jgi:hypothetical protein
MPSVDSGSVRPPYVRAAESRRPYGSHRFEVFSLKARRRLTLFGVAALRCWLRLEATPAVTQLCERPVLLPERKKPVDFWSAGSGRSKFSVVCSEDVAIEAAGGEVPHPAFEQWAQSVGCTVEYVGPSVLAGNATWYANWIDLLQHLARFQAGVTEDLERRAADAMGEIVPVSSVLRALDDVEPARVRAAVYSLVHKGHAELVSAASDRLSDASKVVAA